MQIDLTQGSITKTMLRFAVPMICGNLLQQLYNIVDTLIVGQYLGADALAAVGSAYTLMTFLTSIFLGLCMGSGAIFAIRYGEKNMDRLKEDMFVSFVMTAGLTLFINIFIFWKLDLILHFLSVPEDVYALMRTYLWAVFWGIVATFLYNYYACVLRAVGNSTVPLLFLGVGVVTNIVLDLVFILVCHWGVAGAAWATVIAQWISGVSILIYTKVRCPWLNLERRHMHMRRENISEITQASVLTCLQQSVMNLGILMVQGLVNSFGTVVMAAFAAAVKIDAFAYMPLQDFGNAFSTFIAQNYGANRKDRIRKGIRSAIMTSVFFAGCCGNLCKTASVDLCACTGDTDSGSGNFVSEGSRGVLLRNRRIISAVWIVSCNQQTRCFIGTYYHFTGYESHTGICAICNSGNRSDRYLVGSSNWMVPCRYSWDCMVLVKI